MTASTKRPISVGRTQTLIQSCSENVLDRPIQVTEEHGTSELPIHTF